MAPERRRLRVVVADRFGPSSGLARWLARVAPRGARGLVSVAVVSDARIRAPNRRYRRHDRATDVLSFSYGTAEVPSPQQVLGDIVIARGVARRQARARGHSDRIEIRVLALHGLLHLLGYDHDRDDGLMLRVERRLRRKGGLREGLVERSGGSRASRQGVKRSGS